MTWLALAVVAVVLVAPSGPQPRVPPGRGSTSVVPRIDPVQRLGGWVRRAVSRDPDPAADRWWGWSMLASVALVPVSLPMALALPAFVTAQRVLRRRAERSRRQAAHDAALPEVLELVAVAIRAGGTVPAAVVLVAERGPALTAPAFRTVLARAAAGMPMAVALTDLPALVGESYRPLAAALVSADTDGAPLSSVVSQLVLDAQQARRRVVESRARQVPVRLLVPLVCCTLPAVLLMAVVPLVAAGGGLPG